MYVFRWFIWNFEKLLQQTTGKCIYIPYWDWERDAEFERDADVMHQATFGTWGGNGCVTTGIANSHAPFRRSPGVNNGPPGCVTRNFMPGFSFTGEAQLLAMISNFNQFGDTTGNGRFNDQNRPAPTGSTNSFRIEFENGPHMLVHGIIAGHMGSNWSPSDPLFYLHHANVDRIWTMWQDYSDHDTLDLDEYSSPWHYDSERGLDQRMSYWQAERLTSWDFRMQYGGETEPDYPTVRDVMSNESPLMSVRYQNSYLNTLMPDYEPNPNLFQTATDTVPVKCDRDEWEATRKRRSLNQQEDVLLVKPTLNNTTSTTQGSKPSEIFRSSLKGKDAQEIESKLESLFRAPTRMTDNLLGNGIDVRSHSANMVEVTNEYCGRPPIFTLQEDRDEWDRLCQELPQSTSMAERLALLAESDCNRRGNPRSDDPQIRARVSMTSFDAPSSAYECFHRPDAPPADQN